METGSMGTAPGAKAYDLIHKMEELGEKTGLVVNRKVTRLGMIAAGVATVAVFGGLALIRGVLKATAKR
jgi:hypothetical protein